MFFEMGDFNADTGSPKTPKTFLLLRDWPPCVYSSRFLTQHIRPDNVKPLDMQLQEEEKEEEEAQEKESLAVLCCAL